MGSKMEYSKREGPGTKGTKREGTRGNSMDRDDNEKWRHFLREGLVVSKKEGM